MPKVSIIIPVYNVEKYLKECLDSVIKQTLQDIEIICVNDGSTDNSLHILKEYSQNDSRIKIIDKPNSGYGDSMNKGLDMATGEYIGIVEPDDYVELDMFEILYNTANSLHVDFVKSDFYTFNEDLIQHYTKLDYKEKYYNKILNLKNDKKIFNLGMNTWTGIYNKNFLDKNNIKYNTTPGARYQDQGFWFQTMIFSKSFIILNKAFYHYRFFQSNSTNNPNGYDWIKIEYQHIYDILNKNTDLKQYYIKEFQHFKFCNYLFNYLKLDKKRKKAYLKDFQNEFINVMNKDEIDKSVFSEYEYNLLTLLIKNPNKFYHKLLNRMTLAQKIFSVKNSKERTHKIITICGIKFKIKRKKLG